MMPLRSLLQNGDQVDIITNPKQTPSPEWERFVATGKARARIRRYVRGLQRGQNVELGKKMLTQAFRQESYDLTEKGIAGVLARFRADSVEDIYWMVGEGQFTARDVVTAVYPGLRTPPKAANVTAMINSLTGKRKDAADEGTHKGMPIKGLIPGMALHYAGCCHPLPGDRIVGIVVSGRGVTIHTIDCDQLEQFSDQPERWLDLAWDAGSDTQHHVGRVNLVVSNEPGSLGTLSTVIAKNMGNITNLKITNRSTDFFDMIMDIDVRDVRHLVNIIAALRATAAVSSVERARR
jgi:GTP pyrophosphokinase